MPKVLDLAYVTESRAPRKGAQCTNLCIVDIYNDRKYTGGYCYVLTNLVGPLVNTIVSSIVAKKAQRLLRAKNGYKLLHDFSEMNLNLM